MERRVKVWVFQLSARRDAVPVVFARKDRLALHSARLDPVKLDGLAPRGSLRKGCLDDEHFRERISLAFCNLRCQPASCASFTRELSAGSAMRSYSFAGGMGLQGLTTAPSICAISPTGDASFQRTVWRVREPPLERVSARGARSRAPPRRTPTATSPSAARS
jgi:hypothetical protein